MDTQLDQCVQALILLSDEPEPDFIGACLEQGACAETYIMGAFAEERWDSGCYDMCSVSSGYALP